MPELPEVETVVRWLRDGGPHKESILDETIVGGELEWARSLAFPDEVLFWQEVVGLKIGSVYRRGKYICLDANSRTLIFHLRMSGEVSAVEPGEELPQHSRLILNFASGRRLAFRNVRKFGRAWLVEKPEDVWGDLGPEPFDSSLDGNFYLMLQRHKRMIKPLLMDQKFLAGIGNIYADESLHMAKIHPQTPAANISANKAEELLAAIRQVLNEAIERNGTSIDWMYAGGDYQKKLRVYKRNGTSCLFCGTEIKRIIVGQRGTHFCPSCQKTEQ